MGDWLGLLASAIFASAQVTGSAAKGVAFGSVVGVRMLPALILGPVAGVVADRWDRRYTMVVCDLVRFLMFASIPGITLLTDDSKIIVGWAAAATFVIEAMQMAWGPAKDAAVPNLLPRARLEGANQLTLATTYGVTPVLAGLFLAALTVFFGIPEISGRRAARPAKKPSLWREFVAGWAYVGKTPLVRGLVLGILGAFAGAGVVVGTAQFYARSLGGGDSTFYILFAVIFVGLGGGIVAGPRLVGALSRRRWFGLSIILAAVSVAVLAFAWHLVIAFIQTGTQITLLTTISLGSVLVGYGSSRDVFGIPISTTRLLLLGAGVFGVFAGLAALRQMDDRHGVPLLADLIGSVRGRPLSPFHLGAHSGAFIVLEGGEGAGKSTHAARLAELLRADGREVVLTREPGATEVGSQIRSVLLAGGIMGLVAAPRAEALLYAADRAHHVATVVRPALERGAVVICERYVDSSLAYLEAGRTLPVDEVAWVSGWATGGLKPDLVVLLDIDPAEGLRRADHRPDGAEPDAQALHFAERVRYAFLDRAAKDPKRYLVLDASRPLESVAALVVDRVEQLLPPTPAGAPATTAPVPAGEATPAADEPAGPPPAIPSLPPAPLIAGVATTAEPTDGPGADGGPPARSAEETMSPAKRRS